MIIYGALIIPALVLLFIVITNRGRIQWWEPVLLLLVPCATVFGIKAIAEQSLMYTDEYWNSYGTKVEYYEDWDEYIHQTCTRSYPCGTDSEGNTEYCSETYDCSYVQYHPESWLLRGSGGEDINIDRGTYDRLCAQWHRKPAFVDLNRTYDSNDGDMYYAEWDSLFTSIEPIASQHRYKNKVKPSKNTFGFAEVDPKKDPVKTYNVPNGYTCDYIYGAGTGEDQKLLRQWNAWLGKKKKVVMMVMVYPNQPLEQAFKQESFWRGGNKNEFILCVGVSSDTISWTRVISWTPQTILKAQVEREIKELHKFCLKCIINHMAMAVEKWPTVIRRDFEEFNYLTVPAPLWGIIVAYVLSLVLAVLLGVMTVYDDLMD